MDDYQIKNARWYSLVGIVLLTLVLLMLPWVNPCESEDAIACTWNAEAQGNGIGRSFTNFWGLVIYHF